MTRSLLLTAVGLLLAVAACGTDQLTPAPPLPGGGFGGGAGGAPCDADGDGVDGASCNGADCDDTSAAVHPGATEACDGVDNDCNGRVDEGCGCKPGDMQACYDGKPETRHVGHCSDGYQACRADGTWGPCTGSVGPEGELTGCDGIDSDCNGIDDDHPECGHCAPGAAEVCGNGLDDDCDGKIDPPEVCTTSCTQVNPRGTAPPDLACCLRSPPATHEFKCHEAAGLDACTDRKCIDLDGSLDTRCSKICDQTGCLCGRRLGNGEMIEVADCGFLSPCARLDCDDRQGQPCYDGPPKTLGVGICHAGVHSCERDGDGPRAWGTCEGEQTPAPAEICGNGLDDDCDGFIDEADGSDEHCQVRPACAPGAVELCGNGLDDDCDGYADEGCPALTSGRQTCWTGSLDTRKVGTCKDGAQIEMGGYWGPCTGEVLPQREVCGDKLDTDCNGLGGPGAPEEPACCTPHAETCNGLDDDCDGLADEGLVNRCGQCENTGSCFGTTLENVSDCSVPGRTCEGIEPSRFDPSLITLAGESGSGSGGEHLYALQLVNGFLSLVQVDTGSGQITWQFDLPQSGQAVAAASDGTAWLWQSAGLTHISTDGVVLCKTDEGIAEMAPGAEGDLWVNINGANRHYSATDLVLEKSPGVPWEDGVPRCGIVDLTPGDPNTTDLPISISNVMVHDGNGRLWNFGSGNGVQYVQEDAFKIVTVEPTTSVWFANPVLSPDGRLFGGGPLRWLDPEEAKDATPIAPYHELGNFGTATTNVGALSDSSLVTVVGTPNEVLHVDTVTGAEIERFSTPADLTTSISVDSSDRVWATATGKLLALDVGSGTWSETPIDGLIGIGRFAVGRGGRTTSKGRWAQFFDPGSFDVKWGQLSWDSHAVLGTSVRAQVHFADTPEALATSKFLCGPFASSPADLSACSGGRRYALIELLLAGSGHPVVGNVALTWDRP
jgi:hypothetical protein